MAHHSEIESLSRDRLNQLLGIGATGQFPNGRIAPHDEGELQYAVAADKANQVVIVDFGKSVRSIGFTAAQAFELGELLQNKSWELRGIDLGSGPSAAEQERLREIKTKLDQVKADAEAAS